MENADPNVEKPSAASVDKMTTVFDDGKNFNVKHPLESSWTLWYDYQQRKTNQESWLDSLKKVFSFETVEDFWG
jgi:translation initiation factor 4E